MLSSMNCFLNKWAVLGLPLSKNQLHVRIDKHHRDADYFWTKLQWEIGTWLSGHKKKHEKKNVLNFISLRNRQISKHQCKMEDAGIELKYPQIFKHRQKFIWWLCFSFCVSLLGTFKFKSQLAAFEIQKSDE